MVKRKRKVKVFSDVYNLAGDINDRPNFLKTVVIDQVLHKLKPSMSEALHDAYVGGHGIALRRIVPYAERINYYEKVGQNQATIQTSKSVGINELTDAMNYRFGFDVRVYEAVISNLDIEWWTLQHLYLYFPEYTDKIFESIYDEDTGEIKVDFFENQEDEEPSETLVFPSPSFTAALTGSGEFLYVVYGGLGSPEVLEEVEVPPHPVDEFPDMTGYDILTDSTTTVVFDWNREITVLDVYDDGSENTQYFEQPYKTAGDVRTRSYRKIVVIPASEGQINATRETYLSNNTDSFKLVPVVTNEVEEMNGFTRYTETVNYVLEPQKLLYTHYTLAEIFHLGSQEVFIYQKGSGDGLYDDLFTNAVSGGKYFPFVPIKTDLRPGTKARQVFIDKNDIGSSSLDGLYDMNKKMIRKLTGKMSSYDQIIDSLKDGGDTDKINYAYVIYGATLNTPENAALRYIFHFFKEISRHSPTLGSEYSDYQTEWNVAHQSRLNWQAWYDAQGDADSPWFGEPEPGILAYPTPPTLSISLRSNEALNLNYTVSWNGVSTVNGIGQAQAGMKMGEVRYKTGGVNRDEIIIDVGKPPTNVANTSGQSITYYFQKTVDTWESITIYGLSSFNLIHRGKGISISGHDAIEDSDETGLIIPINEAIFKTMGLVQSTQFATACTYLMINYYSDTKQKWYQTGWFKIVLSITVIVVSAFTAGAGAGPATGIGGAIVSAAGMTGVAAAIVAAVTNAVAAMIISRIVTSVAVKLLGDKIGIIVGAIVSMVTMKAINSYANGQPINLLDSFNADSLLKLASTITQDLGKLFQEGILDIQKKMMEAQEEFDKKSEELNQLFATEFGDRGRIDVLKFLDAQDRTGMIAESPESFIARTLMTGSDISELSVGAISTTLDMNYTLQTR